MTSAPISRPNLRYRSPNEADRPTIAEWLRRDPYHLACGIGPDFFLTPGPVLIAVEDRKGPVMFVRLQPETETQVRIYVQFDMNERRRNAVALPELFAMLRDTVKTTGMTSMIFDSVAPSLIAFCQKRLGFLPADLPGNYIARF